MNLDNVIFVWGENRNPNPPAPPPTVSVSAWPHLFGKEWLKWGDNVPTEVQAATVAFVNVFWVPEGHYVQDIRAVNPHCYIVAMPDPSLDMVLEHPQWTALWAQLAAADMIGGRTHADCSTYGTLLNKPTCYFPSPIGPDEWFMPYRSLPKEDYLLTLDHSFAPANTACNVAAVVAIQRETGIRVIYAAARDHTRHLADLAGLKAEWVGAVNWFEFVEMTARAKICIDMYASHSYGRQQVLCGMVGTVCIGSELCKDASEVLLYDPFNPSQFTSPYALSMEVESYRRAGFELVERKFSFTASRARLLHLLERIENERVKG